MQLDRTQIQIRARSFWDLLDLALRLTATHGPSLLAAWSCLVIPLGLLNFWLLQVSTLDLRSSELTDDLVIYVVSMAFLVFLQAQLGTLLVTAYIGQALFVEHPTIRDAVSQLAGRVGAIVWYLLIVRGVAVVCLLLAGSHFLRHDDRAALSGLLMFYGLYLWIVRAVRPYLPEIIILERLPVFSRRGQGISIRSRNSALHTHFMAETFARWLISAGCAILLAFSLYRSLRFAASMMFLRDELDGLMLYFVLPSVFWLVAGFMAVVRFLAYIDLRIRREGWEVELVLRSAAEDLTERDFSPRPAA